MPGWVKEGFREYARRLPPRCALSLHEVPAAKRTRNAPIDKLREQEGRRLLEAAPPGALLIALDETGRSWSSLELARRCDRWLQGGTDVALLVGGADGLAPACLERAEHVWSLSALTLPHMLVRVVVAEQIYRAWSIAENHPYHRP